MKLIYLFLLLITISSCNSDSVFTKGKDQLENQGYTNVTKIACPIFCCDKNDSWSSAGFKAIGSDGLAVSGCICAKPFGGSVTIRFY